MISVNQSTPVRDYHALRPSDPTDRSASTLALGVSRFAATCKCNTTTTMQTVNINDIPVLRSSALCYLTLFCVFLRCGNIENEKCDVTQALTECHLLSDEVPVTPTLLKPEYHLNVERLARHTYRLLNRSAPQVPSITFEIPRSSSILRSVYPPTTVKDDRTLAAQLIRRDHEWILHVEGELQSCPGQLTCRIFLQVRHLRSLQ